MFTNNKLQPTIKNIQSKGVVMLSQFFANSMEYNNGLCYINGVLQPSTEKCEQATKGILAIFGAILIPLIIVSIVFFVFWILALIHAIKNQDIKDRTMWIVLLVGSFFVSLNWIVTVVYYFVIMRPYKKGLARDPMAQVQNANAATTPTFSQSPAQPQASTPANDTTSEGDTQTPSNTP
jgi:hypothetical protein